MNVNATLTFPVVGASPETEKIHSFYGMATYKPTSKLTVGAYYSYGLNYQQQTPGPGRFQRDYTLSGRYDFSQFVYANAEEHIVGGTLFGYSSLDNANGLKTASDMTIIKIGVSF